MTKVYPTLEGPTSDDFEQAENELYPGIPNGTVWDTYQRSRLTERARQIFTERQHIEHGVH